jgi:hypothetical protein
MEDNEEADYYVEKRKLRKRETIWEIMRSMFMRKRRKIGRGRLGGR